MISVVARADWVEKPGVLLYPSRQHGAAQRGRGTQPPDVGDSRVRHVLQDHDPRARRRVGGQERREAGEGGLDQRPKPCGRQGSGLEQRGTHRVQRQPHVRGMEVAVVPDRATGHVDQRVLRSLAPYRGTGTASPSLIPASSGPNIRDQPPSPRPRSG